MVTVVTMMTVRVMMQLMIMTIQAGMYYNYDDDAFHSENLFQQSRLACSIIMTIMTIMTIQAGMQSTRNSRDFFNPVSLQHQRYASLAGCLVDQYHDAK